jgi:signal transduction histidine kinase
MCAVRGSFSVLRKDAISTTTFRVMVAVPISFAGSVMILFVFILWRVNVYDVHRLSGMMTAEANRLRQIAPAELPRMLAVRRTSGPLNETLVALFGAGGLPIWGKLAAPPPGLPVDGSVHRLDGLSTSDRGHLALALAVSLSGGHILVVARSIGALTKLRAEILRALLLGVIPLVLVGLVATVALSLCTVRRLRTVHEAIARIMRGDLSERLPVTGGWDDINRLTLEMNRVLDQIQHLAAESKSMGDAIAHDLCTPLTRLRSRLDRGRSSANTAEEVGGLIEASIADLDTTFDIMTTLLRIGEIESGRRRTGFFEVDLATIATEVGEIYAPVAEAAQVSLVLRTGTAAQMVGDRDLLVEAVANLVSHAIEVTPPAGQVTIAVSLTPAGPSLSVGDTGPGLPPALREFLLARLIRGDAARKMPVGVSGLCLVVSIVRLHGMQLIIDGGPGCVFRLVAPGPLAVSGPTPSPSLLLSSPI